MRAKERFESIVVLVKERGFVSVDELRRRYKVTGATIRRDLVALEKNGVVTRTRGGAIPARWPSGGTDHVELADTGVARGTGLSVRSVDVLIVTTKESKLVDLLPDTGVRAIPLIAESWPVEGARTCVSVDNYRAGFELGRWVGEHAKEEFGSVVKLFSLNYHLPNTHRRTVGFSDGLRASDVEVELVFSLDAQSRLETAYQLTHDGMTARPDINVIFAVNDIIAQGAIQACSELQISPKQLMIVPFGLEGDTLKEAVIESPYLRGGLAMFPEIVGPACIEASIAAYNDEELPENIVTPFTLITKENMRDYYVKEDDGWRMVASPGLPMFSNARSRRRRADSRLPDLIGFAVPFPKHEWYQKLTASMRLHCEQRRIQFGVVDVEQSLKEELDQYQVQMARYAAAEIEPGETIIIDESPAGLLLAEQLLTREDITVVTNCVSIIETLKSNEHVNLVCTGGRLRHESRLFVGAQAESMLELLRVDKLFLGVTGVSLEFGLSHTEISEVAVKRAMIASARRVVLLADHTYFGKEATIRLGPCTLVHEIITDNALSASFRLDLRKLGIEVIPVKIAE